MRTRFMPAVALVATLAFPLGASANPQPAGCAGIVQVTGNSCSFVVAAGNEGAASIGIVHLASGTTTSRIELLRGNTVVLSRGPETDEFGNLAGTLHTPGSSLIAGTYRCRVTSTGPVVVTAYQCSVA